MPDEWSLQWYACCLILEILLSMFLSGTVHGASSGEEDEPGL